MEVIQQTWCWHINLAKTWAGNRVVQINTVIRRYCRAQLCIYCKADLICSGVPPEVALVMAHAASFLVLNSAFCRMSISTGKMLASITVCEAEQDKKWGGSSRKHTLTFLPLQASHKEIGIWCCHDEWIDGPISLNRLYLSKTNVKSNY